MVASAILAVGSVVIAERDPFALDAAATRWVADTLKKLTLDEKIGQLIVPAVESDFLATDSDAFDELARLVREYHVGGFLVFGATAPAPSVLLNPTYGTTLLGQPLSAASLLNRLQRLSTVPLLNAADFEAGVGYRMSGATTFPRQMAVGAASDEGLTRDAARIGGLEARAIGVHVLFAPLADVNSNPRNPVINVRSFGEDPARVGALVAAYVDGAQSGGVIATLKHFPGHGDTSVDSHLGLPTVDAPRERLEALELAPFRSGFARGARAVMAGHIVLPALDGSPATLSSVIMRRLLREKLGFNGLVYTDSLSMEAIAKRGTPADIAVGAVLAGADQVVQPPFPIAAFDGLKAAVTDGRLSQTRLNESVERLLRAKASLGLHAARLVDLDAIAGSVGGRAHAVVARTLASRSMTLIKDEFHHVPLAIARETPILYLSVLDDPGNWQIAGPSRTFIPELKKRWPQVTSIEVSDRTPLSELDLVRAMTPRFGAVVASVFVRTTSGSGRMDLPPELAKLLKDVTRAAERARTPFVTTFFGNPYTPMFVPELPAMLLTYDLYDLPELSAVRAIAGEAPIHGRLPVALPGMFPVGHGLDR